MKHNNISRILISVLAISAITGCGNDHFPLEEGEHTLLLEGKISGVHFQSKKDVQEFIKEQNTKISCMSSDEQNLIVKKSEVTPVQDNPFVWRSENVSLVDHLWDIIKSPITNLWMVGVKISYQLPKTAEEGDKSISIICRDMQGVDVGQGKMDIDIYKSMQNMYLEHGLITMGIAFLFFVFTYFSWDNLGMDISGYSGEDRRIAKELKYSPIGSSIIGLIVFIIGLWLAMKAIFF